MAARFTVLPLKAWVIAGGLGLVLLVAWKNRRVASGIFLVIAIAAALYTARYEIISLSDLRVLIGDQPKIVSAKGSLIHTPELRLTKIQGRELRSTTARLKISEIRMDEEWIPASGEVAVMLRGELPAPCYRDEVVLLNGVIKPPAPPMIPGVFDFQKYLYHQRIFYQLTLDAPDDWQLVQSARRSIPWSDRFIEWSKTQMLRDVPPGVIVDLLWSMVLGWKTGFTREIAEPFMRTGTLHIFAISGLHVACLAAFLMYMLRVFAVPWHISSWVVIPVLWFYTMATGWQPSAVRSAIMGSVMLLGWALKRPSDLTNSLALAATLILAVEPEQLFQASFQLSFTVVGSIALFGPYIQSGTQKVMERFQPDPFKLKAHWPWWQKYLDKTSRFVASTVLVSIAAWLGALPISAAYFNLFTPVTLLANCVAVPASSLSLGFTALTLMLGGWWGWAAGICNANAWFFMALVDWSNGLFLKFGNWYVPKPGWAFFGLYYLLLVSVIAGWFWRAKWRVYLACGCGLFGIAWCIEIVSHIQKTTLTILPIAGTPIHLDAPGRSADLLIDCSDASGAERQLKPFLRAQGVNSLSNLLLTHGDIDHVEGFTVVNDQFSPNLVVKSSVRFRSPTYKRVMTLLDAQPQLLAERNRGDAVAGWNVLHPSADDKSARADDKTMVLLSSINGVSILILSDLSSAGRNSLLNEFPDLKADLVIAGVPEDSKPVTSEFLQRVGAKLCVLGTVASSRGFQADPPWLEELRQSGINMWLTSETGAAIFEFKDMGCSARTMTGLSMEFSGSERNESE